MRARFVVVPVVLALAAACTHREARPDPDSPPRGAAPAAPADIVVVGSGDEIGAVDAVTGSVLSAAAGAVAEADWSHVYTASASGGTTRIDRIETASGDITSSIRVRGDLVIRAVAPHGLAVAMMPRRDGGGDAWVPGPRAMTQVVVADPTGRADPERFTLPGNFEPEAFSPDAETLYMLQYRPALAPTSYRVIGLYLETGRRWALFGPDKQPVENMTATRLQQVASPNGFFLYTLYTNQRPTYLDASADPVGVEPGEGEEAAFVHTVFLRSGSAVCIELPDDFGTAPRDATALARSPVGHRVYAIDVRDGLIAEVDTHRYRVIHTYRVDLSALGDGPVHAGVGADGSRLFLAGDRGVLSLDTSGFILDRATSTPADVTGLALSPDGERLYLTWGTELHRFDPATLEPVGVAPLTGGGAIEYIDVAPA
jgi:hypothetical protein